MTREKKALELVEDEFRGLVLIALYLVDDDLYLAVHLFLRIGAAEGYVEKEVDGARRMLAKGGAIVDRLLFAREGIQFASHTLHGRDDLTSRAPRGPLERHVLGEMRHSALGRQFVAGPGINGDTQIHHIRLSRSTDNAKALGKRVGCEH